MRIAVVGDYRASNETHVATAAAAQHAAAARGRDVDVRWITTPDVRGASAASFADFDGVWIAPGSPYASLDGALDAIRVVRTAGIPLLGGCAGFQHVVLEYARNVLGAENAQHAEYDPAAPDPFISELSCSLVGETMRVDVRPGTRAAAAYGSASTTERYYCRYGADRARLRELEALGLAVSGTDEDGEARIVELPDLRFFVATLFVPQTSSSPDAPHPLISAFMGAAHDRFASRSGARAAASRAR